MQLGRRFVASAFPSSGAERKRWGGSFLSWGGGGRRASSINWQPFSFRFKQQAANESAVRNLKKLLTYCEDIYVYYKLAYDNQFYDVVNVLLNDAQTGCCLNDLLAN